MRFFDAHCDTVTKIFDTKENFYENKGHLSLKKLYETYKAPIQVFAVWTEPIHYKYALERALEVIDYYYTQGEKNKNIFGHINNLADLKENEKQGKISGILAIEGGEPFYGRKEILRVFYRLGVRVCSLTWNYRNELACGVNDSDLDLGLTEKGTDFVREMERL